MLMTIVVVLIVLWLLGVVTSYTLGGVLHVLLVIAVIVLLIRVIHGRPVVMTESNDMVRILAILLIVIGLIALATGGSPRPGARRSSTSARSRPPPKSATAFRCRRCSAAPRWRAASSCSSPAAVSVADVHGSTGACVRRIG